MVAGIGRALTEGRSYTYHELYALIGGSDAGFSRVFDSLVSEGRVRPVLVRQTGGRSIFALAPFERDLLWTAARPA